MTYEVAARTEAGNGHLEIVGRLSKAGATSAAVLQALREHLKALGRGDPQDERSDYVDVLADVGIHLKAEYPSLDLEAVLKGESPTDAHEGLGALVSTVRTWAEGVGEDWADMSWTIAHHVEVETKEHEAPKPSP